MTDPLVLTRAQAIRLLGLKDRAFHRLEVEGVLPPLVKGEGRRASTFDGPSLVRAYLAHRMAAADILDLGAEKARLARAQRQMQELKLERERRGLVSAEDAADAQRRIATAAKTSLMAVPRRAVLAGLPQEHEALVQKLIGEALRELAGGRS